MKDNIILTDCDGVLLDWESYFYHWVKENYDMDVQNPEEYSVGKALCIAGLHARDLVKEFNASSYMANLGPLRDAVKYVRKLYTDHGFRFHVVTSQTDNEAAQEFRKYNLEKLFGADVFEGFTILPQGADKDDALLKWEDTECYWVEDKPKNASVGYHLGLNVILMGHEHNKLHADNDQFLYANNWKEIYNYITGEV